MPLSLEQAPDEHFAATVAKGDKLFLNRVQLVQPLSDCFLNSKPVCKPGDYVLGYGDAAVNLGNDVQVLVGHYRYHAIVIQDKKVEAESFDLDDPVYRSIEQEVLLRKKKEGRAAKFGIDFLLYFPSVTKFGVYFFAATAKKEAPEALKRQGKTARFKSLLVEAKGNKWFVPKVSDGDGSQPVIDGKLLQTTLKVFTVDKLPDEGEGDVERPR
jgi:hypothetical protein